MIGPTRVLADKGYRGITQVPNLYVVTEENEVETRTRVIVERFFGRLKNSFAVFRRPWELSWRCFSDLFDIGCGLTNVLLVIHSLNLNDWIFNDCVFRKWERQMQERARRNKARYERKKTTRLQEREMASALINSNY